MIKPTTKLRTLLHYIDEESFYFKLSVDFKFYLFLALSIIPIALPNLIVNLLLSLSLLAAILKTGYYSSRPGVAKFLILSLCSFLLVWLLFSKVEGQTIYFQFYWNTYVSDQTFIRALTAATRWFLICQAGMLFLIVTSQNEIINRLFQLRLGHRPILTLTIALNTIAFILEVLPQIDIALASRNIPNTSITDKLRRFRLIGTSLLSENIVRLSFLQIAYHLESSDLIRAYNEKDVDAFSQY